MKKIFFLVLFFPLLVMAQKKIDSQVIYINFDNVKHIVFPATVSDITIGSNRYIQSSIISSAPNIICVAAIEEKFPVPTNLTVVCADGKAYSYNVTYRDSIFDSNVIFAGGNRTTPQYHVLVDKNNTSVLFFPDDVIYIKQGNEESLAIETSHNIAKLKTNIDKILPSNIFVVDSKNNVYNISVTTGKTDSYIYNFATQEQEQEQKYLAKVDVNEIEMDSLLKKTMQTQRKIYSMGSIRNKFEFSLTNILIKNDLLFFVFEMKNSSNIDFDIDFIKCFFVDKKMTKNAIQQEDVVQHIYQNNFQYKIPAKKDNRFVLVFKKFTIPDDKVFKVEIYEKGGGRHINFNIENNIIIIADIF